MAVSQVAGCTPGSSLNLLSLVRAVPIQASLLLLQRDLCFAGSFACSFFQKQLPKTVEQNIVG